MAHSEGFEITIVAGESDDVYDSFEGTFRPAFIASVVEEFAAEGISVAPPPDSVRSWGYGADTMSLVLLVATGSAIFFNGKGIEENWDAWKRLGGRVKRTLSRLKARNTAPRISAPLAASLAVEHGSGATGGLEAVELLAVLPPSNGSLDPSAVDSFKAQPDRYYLFLLRTNSEASIVGITSDGRVILTRSLPMDYHDYLELQP